MPRGLPGEVPKRQKTTLVLGKKLQPPQGGYIGMRICAFLDEEVFVCLFVD